MSDRELGGTEEGLSLPKATIQKIVTEILGDKSGLSFAKDARDLMIEFCVEFVSLISSEANDIAERETKKTIAVEHIDKALRELGFPEYVKEVLATAGESKEHYKRVGKSKHIGAQSGMTEEQLLAQQQELFQSSTSKYHAGPAAE